MDLSLTPPRAVISASRRSDVPAYHSRWLLDRLRAGECEVVHPFTGLKRKVDLRPPAVVALVLWTRDPRPLLDALPRLVEQGYRCCFLVTLNGYPPWLEPNAPDTGEVIEAVRVIREQLGPHAVVWRYDPILSSSETPPTFHLDRVAALGESLTGVTDECITSFVDLYRKTERNLLPVLQHRGAELLDRDEERDRSLLRRMQAILADHAITLKLCCERELSEPGVPRARCVDADRLARLTGEVLRLPARPTRPGCGCRASIDIGTYDTCPRGCVYCYANRTPGDARRVPE